jgi:hypothetical protein
LPASVTLADALMTRNGDDEARLSVRRSSCRTNDHGVEGASSLRGSCRSCQQARSDNRAIFTAASHAQRAVDFLHRLQPSVPPADFGLGGRHPRADVRPQSGQAEKESNLQKDDLVTH